MFTREGEDSPEYLLYVNFFLRLASSKIYFSFYVYSSGKDFARISYFNICKMLSSMGWFED